MALSEVLRGADGLWVAIVAGGEELGRRIPVGAVPYALEASNSATLQGLEPDAFEAAGSIVGHAADPDAHHSSTSDGTAITPVSVEVGDTRIESGTLYLGPEVADALTGEVVETLTGGGEADALHTHAGTQGSVGGCYQVWATAECADGFVRLSHGTMSNLYGTPQCVDRNNLVPVGARDPAYREAESNSLAPASGGRGVGQSVPRLVSNPPRTLGSGKSCAAMSVSLFSSVTFSKAPS